MAPLLVGPQKMSFMSEGARERRYCCHSHAPLWVRTPQRKSVLLRTFQPANMPTIKKADNAEKTNALLCVILSMVAAAEDCGKAGRGGDNRRRFFFGSAFEDAGKVWGGWLYPIGDGVGWDFWPARPLRRGRVDGPFYHGRLWTSSSSRAWTASAPTVAPPRFWSARR